MWMSVCLISSLLHIAAGCNLSGPERTEVYAYSGQTRILPCSCADLEDHPEYVRWTVESTPVKEILGPRKAKPTGDYTGRAEVVNVVSAPGNLSLRISRIHERDDALYRCKINGSLFKDIRLHVKGCTLSGPERMDLAASPGQSVLLPCSCTEPQAKPRGITWSVGSRLAVGEIWSTDLPSELSDAYSHRVKLLNSSPGNLSLLLSNFTERDEGMFTCKIRWHNDTEHRLILLSAGTRAQEPKRHPPYSHIVALAFITIPLAVGCFSWMSLRWVMSRKGNPPDLPDSMDVIEEL